VRDDKLIAMVGATPGQEAAVSALGITTCMATAAFVKAHIEMIGGVLVFTDSRCLAGKVFHKLVESGDLVLPPSVPVFEVDQKTFLQKLKELKQKEMEG